MKFVELMLNKAMMKLVICILMGMFSCGTLFAQELHDSVMIHFRQGRT